MKLLIPRCWQVRLHGQGFNVALEDDEPIAGFYTVRRITAGSSKAAEARALRLFQAEDKWTRLLSLHQPVSRNGSMPSVSPVETERITWTQYWFGSYARGLIFY